MTEIRTELQIGKDAERPTVWTDFSISRPPRGWAWFRRASGPLTIVCDVVLCGMGHGTEECWPEFSHWDGWRRTVPDDIQWRPRAVGDRRGDIQVEGVAIESCPFCGRPPKIEIYRCGTPGGGDGYIIHSSPWKANTFTAQCPCGRAKTGYGCSSLAQMIAKWNERHSGLPPAA
jgi:hypothetical protein